MFRVAAFFTLLPLSALGQDEPHVYFTPAKNYLMPEEAEMHYVLGESVSLRAEPSATSALRGTLGIGAPVKLMDIGSSIVDINGIRSYWYLVNDGDQDGWMWGGYIASQTFGSTGDPTVKFLAGYERIESRNEDGALGYVYRIIATRSGSELDRISVRSFGWGFEEVTNLGNKGLDEVDDIIALHVPCMGGCGCSTGDVMVFWDGGKFHHVADLMGSPDGNYSSNTSFVYPSDMDGLPGIVIRVTSDVDESKEDPNEEKHGVDRIHMKEYLRWDGSNLVPTGKRKSIHRYFLKDRSED